MKKFSTTLSAMVAMFLFSGAAFAADGNVAAAGDADHFADK